MNISQERVDELIRDLQALPGVPVDMPPPPPPSLPPQFGGGNGGDMERRVANLEFDMGHVKKGVDRLEANMSEIKKTLQDMRLDATKVSGETKASLATIEERSKHLPTKFEVFGIVAGVMGAIGVVARLLAH